MPLTPTCALTSTPFIVADTDLAFLDKVSPTFGGKKYLIPPPRLAPAERRRRRMAFINNANLYRRTCDKTGKSIVSIYSPDKPFPVWNTTAWDGDDWDALSFGREFDFSRSFGEQFAELFQSVPHMALWSDPNQENSEYTQDTQRNKNCYMCSCMADCEDCLFVSNSSQNVSCVDCYNSGPMQYCYECILSDTMYQCQYCTRCRNLSDCSYCFDTDDCQNCYGCVNLRRREYYFFNQPLDKATYEREVAALRARTDCHAESMRRLGVLLMQTPRAATCIKECENCTGNYLAASKDCTESYDSYSCEGLHHCNGCFISSHLLDVTAAVFGVEWCYDCIGLPNNLNTCAFCFNCADSLTNSYYCTECNSAEHFFGCIGLRRKKYCILNKQYTKEAYEELVPRIIEHMTRTGEWGEFFHPTLSPFGYNESTAGDSMTLPQSTAQQMGYPWSTYESPQPQVSRVIAAHEPLPHISQISDDIISAALQCEVTGKLYKIIPQELAFYRQYGIAIPRRSPLQRYRDRIGTRLPFVLYDRVCDGCGVAMQTSYAPGVPERIVCEGCYREALVGG